ncbi:MAG TPA: DUF1080 domain-containing protein [Planctomycetota bacterium]|nr:DUF1080 domain-containing protein [Planctomycetota bacterium]
MTIKHLCLTVLLCAAWSGFAGQTHTNPDTAAADPDFLIQGEYDKPGEGLQIATLSPGKFLLSKLSGGLPGQGWDEKTVAVSTATSADVKTVIEGYKRVQRQSPTLGEKAPAGAVVLFDGNANEQWEGAKLESGLLCEGTRTKQKFQSFKLHIEFRLPYKPDAPLGGQGRGNSGVYIFDRYEVQVLDSFGIHYFPNTHKANWKEAFQRDLGAAASSDRTQWCGSLYHFKTPDLNMAYPPLAWQTYDIDFTAPKFEGEKKVANARITVVHNGVKIQDNVELAKGTGAGGTKPELSEGPIYLQGHGNPVRFRNIWIVPQK